jgi:hypothetical protein
VPTALLLVDEWDLWMDEKMDGIPAVEWVVWMAF